MCLLLILTSLILLPPLLSNHGDHDLVRIFSAVLTFVLTIASDTICVRVVFILDCSNFSIRQALLNLPCLNLGEKTADHDHLFLRLLWLLGTVNVIDQVGVLAVQRVLPH